MKHVMSIDRQPGAGLYQGSLNRPKKKKKRKRKRKKKEKRKKKI